jgi:hypothetical protein
MAVAGELAWLSQGVIWSVASTVVGVFLTELWKR